MMPTGTRNLLMELLMGQVQAEQRGAEVEERTNMLPLVRYNDGTTGLGVPGAVYGPAQSAYNMLTTDRLNRALMGDDQAMQQSTRDSFDAASLAAVGSLAAPRPRGSIGMGGRPSPELDMSEAARMARAREMGFDTEQTLYHGSARDFDSFDNAARGSSTGAASAKQAHWLVSDPRTAAGYAEYAAGAPARELLTKADTYERLAQKTNQNSWWDKYDDALAEAERLDALPPEGMAVYPLHVRGNMLEHDFGGSEFTDVQSEIAGLIRRAKSESLDGVLLRNLADDTGMNGRPADHYGIFDPSNIRSVNAAFDPAKKNSTNILASRVPSPFWMWQEDDD